jgi:hypothetical protein
MPSSCRLAHLAAFVAIVLALAQPTAAVADGLAVMKRRSNAYAHGGLFPVTSCGPGLSYLCSIRGFFDLAPFKYHLAIYPGCIRTQVIQTPSGPKRTRVLVCG